MNEETTPAAAAWQRLLASLREAGETVTGPLGARTDRERAEGYRHLTRILSVATEMLLEKGDAARPELTRWMTPHRKILGDNPHTVYDAALVDPDRTYRIAGTCGSPAYLGFCVYGTAEDGARDIVDDLDDVDLQTAPEGAFELWLAPEDSPHVPAGADRLALADRATDIMVRQYFRDPAVEVPARYTIEAVPEPAPPPPLSETELARRLDAVGAWVREILAVEVNLSALMASATPQVLRHGDEYVDAGGEEAEPPVDPDVVARAMPSPAIQYSGAWFDDLGDDEMMVVEGTAPEARYWSVQLLNRWMESGDYRHHRVFLTGEDIAVDRDRGFRVVVAHRDPGEPNWIDTAGWRNANIAVRALKADGLLEVEFRREPMRERRRGGPSA